MHSTDDLHTSLIERLGYGKDVKLLIIHADDLGVNHSENAASIASMENGWVNSASIMVTCPWFPEIAIYAKKHRDTMDFGVHLTLTSEWEYYKWGPVTSIDKVSSLVDSDGFLYPSIDQLLKYARLPEVELELGNQIKKAQKAGIAITHLDTHMFALKRSRDFLEIYLKLGREFNIPVLLSRDEMFSNHLVLTKRDMVVDELYMAWEKDYDNGIEAYYRSVLKNLKPGLSCLLVHTAYNDEETRAMTTGHKYWNAEWRQRDFDFFNSMECEKLLMENKIELITWREIRDKFYGRAGK